ncbi:hypothetical protein DFH08DRAFT_816820 [Mycena albidolilacea]|uniref:CxC5 like cysteine cluster associated with KDZ domain-containing protein n=1 Tax=Mycena albidolilacea TaxID=1033008 RepID=A0AAD6ZJP8_9AGAR|nr:hypothetical protein DFH08DRAFT_816820 [Mycena albidolilacea]
MLQVLAFYFCSPTALLAVLQLLDQHPHLQHIQVLQLPKFLRLAALLKQDIGLAQPATLELDSAPDHLPQSVSKFLADATGVGSDAVPNLWAVFRDEVWTCTNAAFPRVGAALTRAEQRQVVVYSLAHGIGEHQFAELKLVNMWISSMLVGWFSATNCAKMYDVALSDRANLETGGWQFGLKLTTNHIWDTFVIKSLLDDRHGNSTLLQVDHAGDQNSRFEAAMHERNKCIILPGQDKVPHYCDRCMRVWEDEKGNLHRTWVIASDGNNMGHPLSVAGDTSVRNTITCIRSGCNDKVVDGTKAYSLPAHQQMKRLNAERGRAAFTLKHRLQRQKIRNAMASAPSDGPPTDMDPDADDDDEVQETIEWFDIEEDGAVHRYEGKNLWSVGVGDKDIPDPCDSKSDQGNRKIKALFHQRRTHNEQTLVRPCGVIFARATFFGAEAVSNVLLFVKNAFSVPGAHKPDHFIYDTNCDAKQQVMKDKDLWWDSIGITQTHLKGPHPRGGR